MAIAGMGGAVGGVEVGAVLVLVLISCLSQWWVVAIWVLAIRDWAWMCSVMIEVLARLNGAAVVVYSMGLCYPTTKRKFSSTILFRLLPSAAAILARRSWRLGSTRTKNLPE